MSRWFLALALVLSGCGSGGGSDTDAGDVDDETPDAADTGDDGVTDTSPEVECTGDEDCDDSDPCTVGACDEGFCEYAPTDADEDGFAAAEVGGTDCGGTDCVDDDDEVFPGSTVRRCDEDADCNGRDDRDNDGDGHDREDCGGADCNDEDVAYSPDGTPGCGDDPEDPADDVDCNGLPDADNDDDGHVNEACTAGTDCDDADASVNPDVAEVCLDGVDQDCDGIVDGPGLRIADALIASGYFPSVTWLGSSMGVCWSWGDGFSDDISYVPVPLSGIVTGRVRGITSYDSISRYPTVLWTGSNLGICWEDDRYMNHGAYFSLTNSSGFPEVSEMRVTHTDGNASYPDMTWSGSHFALVWGDWRSGVYGIYMGLVDSAGAMVGTDFPVTTDGTEPNMPSVVWAGSEYGVSWHESRDGNNEIYFARVSDSGTRVGSDVRITSDSAGSSVPSLAWTGSEYGLAWADRRDGNWEIYFTRVSASGAKVGSDIRITNTTNDSDWPNLLWVSSFFALAWHDMRDMNHEIYMVRLAPDGTEMDPEFRVTNRMGASRYVDTTWTGSELGLVWSDQGVTPTAVLAAYISFCD